MPTTEDRLKAAGEFVDAGVVLIQSGSTLTENTYDDRLARAAELLLAKGGIARDVVVNWLERSTRGGQSALDTTFDAASQLEPEGIDIGLIKDLVAFLLKLWEAIRTRGVG